MKSKGHRQVSAAVLYTPDGKLLMQDREGISKFGEEYDFFGGGIEEGESPKEALLRELKEEIDFVPEKAEFFLTFEHRIDEENSRTFHVFLARAPPLEKITVKEGARAVFLTTEEALSKKLLPGDEVIVREFVKRKTF